MQPPRTGQRRARAIVRVLIAAVVFESLAVAIAPGVSAAPPDIVLILTDDQRPETLGWMRVVQRRLVRRGRTFRNAMVPTSVCCPSRASILTGLFAHDTRVWSNHRTEGVGLTGGWPRFHEQGLEDRTIATWLQAAGYRTALVGKYLNAYDLSPGGYVPPGWNAWHVFDEPNGLYYDYRLRHTDGSVTRHGSAAGDYSTDVLRRFAIREIRRTPGGTPLFLMFAPYAPHPPATAARRHIGLGRSIRPYRTPAVNEDDVRDKPRWIRRKRMLSLPFVDEARRRQFAALRSVDGAVDAILGELGAAHRLHDTLFVFMSDNGELWGEHRLRGKFMPYDAASSIPLVIRWDGHVRAGSRTPRLALNLDVAATIADAAGVATPPVAGRSLLGRGSRAGFVLEAPRTSGHDGNGQRVARPAYCGYRTQRFLYVRYRGGTEELYDYRKDPRELTNLARRPASRDLEARLRRKARRACVPTPPSFSW